MAIVQSLLSSSKPCRRCGDELLIDPYETSQHLGLCEKCSKSWVGEMGQLERNYFTPEKAVKGVKLLLEGLAEAYPDWQVQAEHIKQTPQRVARMFIELCWGLGVDPAIHLKTAFEESEYGGIVLIKDIQFTSLCLHHFAIFRGVAHVGYIPEGKIVGLSKINRVVEIVAARPQVQEQLTFQVANVIEQNLRPKGVAVVVEGTHDCIEVRGVRSKGSTTKTSIMRGVFLSNHLNCREEFMKLIEK